MNISAKKLVFGTLIAVLSSLPGMAALAATTTVDSLQAGDVKSAQSHRLQSIGNVQAGVIEARVGTIQKSYPVWTISGKGSTLQCEFEIPTNAGKTEPQSAPLLLEIEEIHDRRPEIFGYWVLVNGKEVYFRTYEEMSAGPNHYFVQFGRNMAPNGKVQVSFRNAGEAPFSIGRVWAYPDFFAVAEKEGVYRKMPFCDEPGILLGAPKYDKAAQPGVTEEDYTKPLWETLKSRFENTPYLPGSRSATLYAIRSQGEVRQTIDKELKRAARWNFPSQMSFIGTEWGGHPMGMDGLGGYFGDVKYSAICFTPATKTFHTSWPQSAGGVTWPTWNDPQLQKFLTYRMELATKYYADQRAFLKARGQNPPPPLVCQEWGLSVPALGDWNNATVEAARREGVALKPGEKLDHAEKMWIQKNLSDIPSRFAANFRQAAKRDSVLVDRGDIRLPEGQLFDQYYFHTFYPAVQPLYNDRWAGWQTGAGSQVWTTGETGPHVPHAYYDYVIALGKLATVNLERGFFRKNLDFIHTLYELGFQWVTPCNSIAGDADLFLNKTADEIDQKPAAPPLHFDQKVLDVRFQRDEAIGSPEQLIRAENLTLVGARSESMKFLQLEDASKPGRVLYRLTNGGRPIEGALTLVMTGKVEDGPENYLEIATGKDPSSLRPIGRVASADFVAASHWPWTRTARFNLGESLRGEKSGCLELVFHVKNKNTAVNARLDEIRVAMSWQNVSGQASGAPFTVKQCRTLRLWIQDRAVFERLQEDYCKCAGEDAAYAQAAALAQQGRYRAAYRLLAGEISQVLPATFAVRGHGQLGRYPVSLQLAADDKVALVELKKTGPDGFEFTLKTEEAQPCKVELAGLRDGERYALETVGPNSYRLAISANGASGAKASGGHAAFNLEIQPAAYEGRKLPRHLSGVFVANAPGGICVDTQEPDLWMDNPIFVPVADHAIRTRALDCTTGSVTKGFQSMDKLELTIDDAGLAQEIKATYGKDAGRIKVFHPPVMTGEVSNGVIELENGHRYQLGNRLPTFTKFEVQGLKPHYRNNAAEDLVKALVPGMQVEIDYCPYTYNNRLPLAISVTAKSTEK